MKAKITLLILFFLGCVSVNAQSFLISFPNHAAAPVQNPRNLTVCNSSSLLQVRLDVATASATGGSVTIQLPAGIEYVSGSVLKNGGTAALTITDNGGTVNAPQFKLGPNSLTAGDYIVFTIDRKATCTARTSAISGTTFKDIVTGTITGQTASTGTSSAYQVSYPVFSFTQPATQNNAVIGQTYSRTFTITNGGNGCTNEVNFTIDYPSNGIKQTSLTLGGVAITPTSTVGTTSYYTINAAQLPGGDFCFGEALTFTETYLVKTCSAATNYSAGWGCGLTPATWCQTVSGSAGVTMVSGVPNYSQFTVSKVGYVNDCTPFSFKVLYKNAGTGNTTAATMYNAAFNIGQGVAAGTALQNMQFQSLNLNAATINGKTVPHTGGTGTSIYSMNLKDLFTADPDGVGVGLDDLDGDGFYDDLPAGASVTFDIAALMNCSATCNISRSLYYSFCGTISYTTMCSSTVATSDFIRDSHYSADRDTPLSTFFGETLQTADNSYAPSNVDCGVPFRMRFSVNWYAMAPLNFNANQKWTYEITLPAGVSLSGTGNPQWNNGKDINSTTFLTPTITQTGNVVTVVSPGVLPGMVYLDLVVDCNTSCGAGLTIPYNFKYINDKTASCNCNSAVFCGTYTVGKVVCPGPCPAGGASIRSSKVERADNSLGWTNTTLTTHQVRSAISAYDLSKALYLDQIDITATGVQNGIPAANLYLNTSINKYAGNGDKLTPLSIDVVIKRAGVTVSTGTSTTFTTTGTTTTGVLPSYGIQVIRWNLTAALPAGGLLAGDTYETVAHYTVSTNALPNNDVQTGNGMYFYNLDAANNEVSCNNRVPELYLVGTSFGFSPYSQNATNACGIASSQSTIFRQYAASGNFYKNEIRPGYVMTAYTVTVPAGYAMVGVKNTQFGAAYLTPASVVGNTYRYELPVVVNDLRPSLNYQSYYVDMSPTCATAASESYSITGEFQDLYYHYKDLGFSNPDKKTQTFTVTVPYNAATKPTVAFTNQTGTIQASKPTESFTVRLANTGTATAPYTWISVPNVSGVTITQIVDVATNTALTPINYAGGVWFKLSAAGLTTAATKDYRIDFNYTTCVATTINVDAGWNCASFPTDPSGYTCNHNTIALPFIPQTAEVQIITVKQPTAPVDLCTAIPFEYRMNSAGAGNTVNNKFVVDLPVGMFYESGSIQAEYPANSGNWSPVIFTSSGTRTTVDLSSHPNYPIQGLPGTLNDGGNNNLRLIGLRFSLNTNCDFVAGSNINIFASANRSCGAPATGDGVGSASLSINANGVVPGYFVVSNLALTSGSFNNCNSPVVFSAAHTIVSSVPTGSTGSAHIILPPGYDYVAGSYACVGSPCATFKGIATNGAGQRYIDLGIPAGMNSGDKLNYTFAVEKTSSVACSNYRVVLQTVDDIAGVGCSSAPGGICSNIAIQTGSTSYEYTISNPTLEITSFKGTYTAGTYSGSVSVTNTSTLNQTNSGPANPVKISFYCADASGNQTGSLLGTYTMTGSIAAGATSTENYTLSGASACGAGKIVAVISTADNCICETATKTMDLLPVATNDSHCYTQGATSTVINVLANDTTGDTIVPATISLIAPVGATGIITDGNGDVISMTIDLEGTWNVNETTGEITFVPVSNTILNPRPIQYTGRDAEGNISNIATLTAKTSVEKVGTESTSCSANGLGYTLNVAVKGLAPYTVTGTGAPGTWSGNSWTSGTITTGTNYNVSIQDANGCNNLLVSGTAPVCCLFEVTHPTFAATTISCYTQLPTATSLTKSEFEALGNANGFIGTNPCGVLVISASNGPNPGCSGTVTRTYTVTEYADTNNNKVRDAGENTVLNTTNSTQTFTIDRADFTMPANQGSTVACASGIVAPTVPVVKDNCGNTLTASAPVISATPACGGDVTYTYTFTDCEGNAHNWVYTYTIERADFTMPANQGSTVPCASGIVAPAVPVVKDNCGNTLTASAPVISSTPACEGDVTYTYTFTDCEGNAHNWVYTYTIESADFTMPANQGSTVACVSGIVAPAVPVVKDNCGNALTASAPVISATPACEGDVTYTYTFTDCEGNAHNWVYTYTIDDTIAPTGIAPADITVQCISEIPVANVNLITDAADNCSGGVVITVSDTNNGGSGSINTPYIVTRTYTLTDCSGLKTNLIQTITVKDTQVPQTPVLADVTIGECSGTPVAPTTIDACSGTITGTTTTVFPITKQGTTVVTWTFDDGHGNTTTASQNVIVKDTTAPTIPVLADVTIGECSGTPVAPTTIDACAGMITGTTTTVFPITKQGTTVVTWTFNDGNGNTIQANQNVIVKDTTVPVVPALADVTLEGCSGTPETPKANDACAGIITGTTSAVFPIAQQGTTVVTWIFDDGNGNITSVNQNVIMKNTIPAPISGGDQSACVSENVKTLTATASAPEGTKVVWYTSATAGNSVTSPTLNTVGTVTYYAETVNTTSGCSSLTRTPVSLTLYNCSIGLIKTVVFDDNNNDGFAQAGETLSYSFEITNLGNVPLTHVSVTDIKEGLELTGDPISLEAGETNSTEFKGIYKLTQADINSGKVSNQATVTGTTPLNTTVSDVSDNSSLSEDKPTVLDVTGCVIEVFNAVSPNEDGKNDAFYIRGLECYSDNRVEIYNRWGVLVFERDHYNNTDRVFKGISEGRTTVSQSSELPAGTYFYILKYKDMNNGGAHEKSGYLYITR